MEKLDFYKMLKHTIHDVLEDPAKRKKLEKFILRIMIEYAKQSGYHL